MAGKRVAVLTPEGKFGTVDEADVGNLPEGARVLTKQQIAEREVQERYDALPTSRKVAGLAQTATAAINPLMLGASPDAPPTVAAFGAGAREGLTAGASDALTRQAIDVATGGTKKGDEYAAQVDQLKEAKPIAHGAGNVTGMLAGSALGGGAGAARALPSAAIGAAGNIAERGAAKVLGGLATRGALGRAAATAGELGARGAVEGGLYGAAEAAADMGLHNQPLDAGSADKVFAAMGTGMLHGGAGSVLLGGAGSLAASGIRAGANAALGTMGRAMAGGREAVARGEEAVAGAVAKAEGLAARAEATAAGVASKAEDLAARAERTVGELEAKSAPYARSLLDDVRTVEGQKGLAYDQAWKAVGAGQGLQTTRFAGKANRYLPNGTRDVGEALMRRGVINHEAGWFAAAKGGTPADMLPRIESELETVGGRIGEITSVSPARVAASDIDAAIDRVAKPLEGTAAFRNVGQQVRGFGNDLREVMGITAQGGKVQLANEVSIQALLDQRKALDKLVYAEAKALDPKGRVAALRDLRTELENVITDSLDAASDKVAGVTREEYKALKKDYLSLSIAKEAAEDSATRMAKNRTVSPTDYAAGLMSAASGNLLAAPVAAIGHKVMRERGNAAAAVAIYRAAQEGTITKWVQKIDTHLDRAAKGLLMPPAKAALPAAITPPKGRPQAIAQAAMKQVAAVQADPEGLADRITSATQGASPELAGALSQRLTSAYAFLAEKMPVSADPDPLDPHPAPHMTDAQAAEFARFAWYTEKPERFFVEVAHGKLTPEGAETAQRLMPDAFAELQQRTADALATHMARGRSIPYQQRLVIGQLLDFAATPSQRVDHMQLLQSNVLDSTPTAPAPKRSSAKIPTQQSALDRLEGRGPGHR